MKWIGKIITEVLCWLFCFAIIGMLLTVVAAVLLVIAMPALIFVAFGIWIIHALIYGVHINF